MTDPTLIKYSNEIIANINKKVENYSQCHPLKLHHVDWAWMEENAYHIQLFAQKQSEEDDQSLVSFHGVVIKKETPNVERTDRYARTADCILDPALQSIKPFCICKKLKYFFF